MLRWIDLTALIYFYQDWISSCFPQESNPWWGVASTSLPFDLAAAASVMSSNVSTGRSSHRYLNTPPLNTHTHTLSARLIAAPDLLNEPETQTRQMIDSAGLFVFLGKCLTGASLTVSSAEGGVKALLHNTHKHTQTHTLHPEVLT